MVSMRRNPFLLCKSYCFLIAIFFVILLAEVWPSLGKKGGYLKSEITVEYGAVATIFFVSGLSMDPDDMKQAAKNYDFHIFVQTFSLFFVPIFVKSLTVILQLLDINEWILKGLIIVSCMPPSHSSVILARGVGANEAAAVFNCVLGSILGIFTTPSTLLFFLHATTLVPPISTILELAITVTLPLIIGMVFRKLTGYKISNVYVERIGEFALLLLLYTTFCDLFIAHENMILQPTNVVLTIFLVVVIQLLLLYICFLLANHCHFSTADVTTMLFSSTHKSLTLGIPILRILYAGYNHLFAISLPLMMYYPIQVILGGLISGELQYWMNNTNFK